MYCAECINVVSLAHVADVFSADFHGQRTIRALADPKGEVGEGGNDGYLNMEIFRRQFKCFYFTKNTSEGFQL